MTYFFNLKKVIIIVSLLTFILASQSLFAATVLDEIQTTDFKPERILVGCQPNEYWIVDSGDGLILLEENPPGNWTYSHYPIGYVTDATGPDSIGRIYCSSYIDGAGSVIQVFDCFNRVVVDNIYITSDSRLRGLTLSPDNSYIYVLNWGWPVFGESYSWVESAAHQDSGIIWQIDTSTLTVVDQGITCALPETIYYAETISGRDRLLISAREVAAISYGVGSIVDVILPVRGLPRETWMVSPRSPMPYRNDFFLWSEEDMLVAMCCATEPDIREPEFMAGLWIIDPELCEVVDYIDIVNQYGGYIGVRHACVSSVYPGHVYISSSTGGPDDLFIIDHDTGEIIETIETVEDFTSQFIYETPDGLIIVTGGDSEKILIIDPSQ